MTEETFVRELERRADDVQGAPLSFDDVRGRARQIRRRRRTTAAAAVAAAVAVVAIVPVVLSGDGARKSDAPDPAPPAPSRSAVLHDGEVTLPDGSTVLLNVDNADVTQFAVLTDGRIVLAMSQPKSIRVYSSTGELVTEHPVPANVIIASADDRLVAWVDKDRDVQVLESGIAEPVAMSPVPLPGETWPFLDAVLGSDCASGGCSVLAGEGNYTTSETAVDGEREVRTDPLLRVYDVSPDGALWAVQYTDDADPQFGCSGMYDPAADQLVTENCETSLLEFAPDGEHLSGSRGDGGTWRNVEVFDSDLQRVLTYEPSADRVVKNWAWADADHLLVTVVSLGADPEWSLLRVPIDGGEPEVVEGPVAGPDAEVPSVFLLAE